MVREEVGLARQVFNGSSKWWQRWLGQAPPVSLQGILPEGAAHNISWEEFAHTTCYVRVAYPSTTPQMRDEYQDELCIKALLLGVHHVQSGRNGWAVRIAEHLQKMSNR